MRRPQRVERATSTALTLFLYHEMRLRELSQNIVMMQNIYRKSFVFWATRFEEYQDGKCLNNGDCNTVIIAKVMNSECIAILLQNNVPVKINRHFGLPIFGIQNGDVLDDRIQYGRIPDSLSWDDSNEPVVCNIFNNLSCIRFAMMSPLRIVEFYGHFTDVREL